MFCHLSCQFLLDNLMLILTRIDVLLRARRNWEHCGEYPGTTLL